MMPWYRSHAAVCLFLIKSFVLSGEETTKSKSIGAIVLSSTKISTVYRSILINVPRARARGCPKLAVAPSGPNDDGSSAAEGEKGKNQRRGRGAELDEGGAAAAATPRGAAVVPVESDANIHTLLPLACCLQAEATKATTSR